jgi:hypothetical protein
MYAELNLFKRKKNASYSMKVSSSFLFCKQEHITTLKVGEKSYLLTQLEEVWVLKTKV